MIEDELRRALHDHTAGVEGQRPGWADVEGRAGRMVAHRRRRMALTGLSAAAAIALVVAAVAVLNDGDGGKVRTVAPAQTTTTEATTTTTASTTTTTAQVTTTTAPVIPDPESVGGIYPDSAEYDRVGAATFRDPVDTALAFARDYVGMTSPIASEAAEGPTPTSRRVTIRPNARAGITTVVVVAQIGGGQGPWTVTGARAASIVLDDPVREEVITSPTKLSGSAHAFEGHVNVEVRDGGMKAGRSLGETFVTGGGDERRPFEGSISFRRATKKYGALVLFESSAEDGSPLAATVIPVAFR